MGFTEEDEGLPVVDSGGRELGVVDEVTRGTAFVRPLPDLEGWVLADLGWGGDDRETYRLDEARVESRSGSAIELRRP